MSSSPISQLLQITAPRAETKSQQPNSPHDGQFHDLLARASSTVEGEPNQGTETPPVQQSDEPLTDNPEQDASPQYDEAPTTSDAPSDAATETLEVQEDNQSDVIELTEAAELLLGTQVVPEEILTVEVTTEPTIEASVIDAPSVENYLNQSEPEPQAATEQFAKTIEVNPPVNQYDQFTEAEADGQAVFVEPPQDNDSPAQEGPELPASDLIADSDGEPADKDFSERAKSEADRPIEQLAQTIAVEKHSQRATTRDVERPKSATQAPPAKAEGSVAVEAEGSVAVEAEGSVAVEAEGSVTVEAEGSVTVEAEGSVAVEAEGSVAVEAEGSVTVEAEGSVAVEAEGSVAVEAEGSVTVEAEGSVTVEAEGSVAVEAEGSVAVEAEGSVAVEAETPEESNDRATSSHEPKEPRASEPALAEPDTVVGTQENISVAKEASPVQSSPSSPAVVNSASDEAAAAVLRSPTGPTGEGSTVNADLDLVSTIDRARFAQRVSRAFQTAHVREGQIQLRLSPPELGSLRISITVHEGVVSAKVEAETAAARSVLLDNLPALRERLAEQEIRIEKFDVDVRRDGGQETGNSGPNDRQARQSRADSASSPGEREPGHLETTLSPRHINPISTVTDGRLDVRI